MSEGPIIGIDLGTTQSAVGVVDCGFPILLADAENSRLTPSAVVFEQDCSVLVGKVALESAQEALVSVKSFIGRRWDELSAEQQKRAVQAEQGGAVFETAVGLKRPEEVSAEVLRHLKAVAENRLEQEVSRAVVTVPAYFNDGQRSATKRAGELAGLEIVRILSEPTAAALAYGLDRLEESARVVVFDLGGGTFDVSILEMREGVFEVLATAGDTDLGGDDFDREIAMELAAQAGLNWEKVSVAEKSRFLREGRELKHQLGEADEATLERGHGISREEFEARLAPFLKRMEACCWRALHDSGVAPEDLAAVVMVGGSSRVPAVRALAERIFEQKPDLGQHPDEAIARGAAIQAGVLDGTVREVLLLDVTPLSLGIETLGGLMNVIIPRNTTIPCKAGELFANAADGQTEMALRVLQGERELAKDNWELGSYQVPFTPAKRGQARVGVEFRIDGDGILSVLARDVATNQDTLLQVGSAAVDVSEARVEQMVSESVEFAFEDFGARIFQEAKLKAEELLPAVEVALTQAGDLLSEDDQAAVAASQEEVKQALTTENGAVLKAAVEKLDKHTEELAALFLQRAAGLL